MGANNSSESTQADFDVSKCLTFKEKKNLFDFEELSVYEMNNRISFVNTVIEARVNLGQLNGNHLEWIRHNALDPNDDCFVKLNSFLNNESRMMEDTKHYGTVTLYFENIDSSFFDKMKSLFDQNDYFREEELINTMLSVLKVD